MRVARLPHQRGSRFSWRIILTGRLLVPDGEAVFGQLADPPPSCQNLSLYSDPKRGPIADLDQWRGNSFILAAISSLGKMQASRQVRDGALV